MSSAIDVYAVSLERLEGVLGSGNQAMIDAIVDAQEDFLSDIDAIDDEAEMSCADAVAELINGETSEDGPGYLYGYALEAICAHLGETLPNISPVSGASDWIEKVDAVLESKQIPVRLDDLVYAGSPVLIPEPDDFPFIGYWPAEKVPAALAAFESLDPAGVEDKETAQTLTQVRSWLLTAATTVGVSIIGFLS